MIDQVIQNYKIHSQLGKGGMGTVYEAVDQMLERKVAIKVLHPELVYKEEILKRFRSEAVTLANLNHPNIATLFNLIRHKNTYLMVMEFVDGESLDALIKRKGALDPEKAVNYCIQGLEGLQHAHQRQIIHRDLKSANLMLSKSGLVKVMDFGIARVLGSSRLTQTGHAVGTLEYMAPEQVRGEEGDERTDIYAMGVVLYEMLTGKVPFKGESDYELMTMKLKKTPPPLRGTLLKIPSKLEKIVLKALQREPGKRFRNAGGFQKALEAVLPVLLKAKQELKPLSAAATRLEMRPGKELYGSPEPIPGQVKQKQPQVLSGFKNVASDRIDGKTVRKILLFLLAILVVGTCAYFIRQYRLGNISKEITNKEQEIDQSAKDQDEESWLPSDNQTLSRLALDADKSKNPFRDQIESWLKSARLLFNQDRLTGENESAWSYCMKIFGLDPDNPEATELKNSILVRLEQLGDDAKNRKEYSKAKEYYKNGLSIDNSNVSLIRKLKETEDLMKPKQPRQSSNRYWSEEKYVPAASMNGLNAFVVDPKLNRTPNPKW